MDMQKFGKFLAELRKEKNLTQDELGEKIGVTNKTISRWENGNYLPPVDLLQILSKLFDVSLNELISGERFDGEHYKKNAEEFMVTSLIKKQKEAKKRLAISVVVACMSMLSGVAFVLFCGLLSMPVWLRITCVTLSAIIISLGIGVCCALMVDAGVYECPNCGEKFIPSMKDFVSGMHTLTKRKLKCPNCGKKSYCKKRLS